MHALIENGAVKEYPYGLAQLKKAHRNVSFPRNPSDEVLASFDVHNVSPSTRPTVTNTQELVEQTPVFTEGQGWVQVWSIRNLTADEVQQHNDGKALEIRNKRNEKLSGLDWTQLPDSPVDKAAWATHRQALRDITSQAGFPWTITWPDAP